MTRMKVIRDPSRIAKLLLGDLRDQSFKVSTIIQLVNPFRERLPGEPHQHDQLDIFFAYDAPMGFTPLASDLDCAKVELLMVNGIETIDGQLFRRDHS